MAVKTDEILHERLCRCERPGMLREKRDPEEHTVLEVGNKVDHSGTTSALTITTAS